MIRTLFISLWTVLVTLLFATLTILASFFSKSGNTPHNIARVWAKCLLLASGIKVTVKGLSNITPTKSYIFMPNHVSNFDIPVLLAHLLVQFRWLAKAELFKIPVFGYAMQRAGYISIDRTDRASAIKSLRKAGKMIGNGVSVLIFPEGTRSYDNTIQPFKKGGFVLAVEAGVPIVPVIIHGTWPIMSKNKLRIKSGEVVLEVAKPIDTSNYTLQTKDNLMEKVRTVIIDSFEQGKKDRSLC